MNKNELKAEIGSRLKYQREKAGIELEALAAVLELDVAAYVRLEKGMTDLSTEKIMIICSILKITPNDLFPEMFEYDSGFEVREEKVVIIKKVIQKVKT